MKNPTTWAELRDKINALSESQLAKQAAIFNDDTGELIEIEDLMPATEIGDCSADEWDGQFCLTMGCGLSKEDV